MFDSIVLYNGEKTQFREHTLYFTHKKDLQLKRDSECVFPYIVIAEDIPCDIPFAFLFVKASDVLQVFAQIQEITSDLKFWLMQMEIDIIQGCNLQHLLDLSEIWISHGLCIWDSTFSLLAYTKHVSSENYIFKQLIAKGYMPSSIMKRFISCGVLQRSNQRKIAAVNMLPNVASCIEIVRSLIVQEETHAILTLFVDDGIIPHEGYVELIELLCLSLQKILILNQKKSQDLNNNFKGQLISYLIDNPDCNIDELEEKAASVNLPLKGSFLFSIIRFKDDCSFSQVRVAMSQLQRKRAFSDVFIRDTEICFLNTKPILSLQSEVFKNHLNEMLPFLELHNAYTGTSSLFFSINEINTAYIQANTALIFNAMYGYKNRLTMYSEYYLQHLLSVIAKNNESSFFFRPLEPLIQYDAKNGSDNLHLLKLYLENERNITKTAQSMHLHRNSVVYRVNKIKTLMNNCNFNDQGIRMQIYCSLIMLENRSMESKNDTLNNTD